jgi:hypothetical protein
MASLADAFALTLVRRVLPVVQVRRFVDGW